MSWRVSGLIYTRYRAIGRNDVCKQSRNPTLNIFFWEYRIAAIAGDCKFPGLTAFVGASPTAPTILDCV